MNEIKVTINGRDYVPAPSVELQVFRSPEYRKLKEMVQYLIAELETMEGDAAALYQDMKDQGLTANTIETEGYLRAMRAVLGTVKYTREVVFPEIDLNNP